MTAATFGLSVATISPQTGWLTVIRPRDELGVAVPQESDDDELTPAQAAALAGVSRWKILRDAKAGKLPSRELPKTGNKEPERRYRRGDVKAYRGPNAVDVRALQKVVEEHEVRIFELERRLDERGHS